MYYSSKKLKIIESKIQMMFGLLVLQNSVSRTLIQFLKKKNTDSDSLGLGWGSPSQPPGDADAAGPRPHRAARLQEACDQFLGF